MTLVMEFQTEAHLLEIPIITVEKGWKGWLEDRRPASNADPYKVAGRIVETVKSADV